MRQNVLLGDLAGHGWQEIIPLYQWTQCQILFPNSGIKKINYLNINYS